MTVKQEVRNKVCPNCGHEGEREVTIYYCNFCGDEVHLPRVTVRNNDTGHEAHFHWNCYEGVRS